MSSKKPHLKQRIRMPSLAEDRKINAGIAADPDTYELSDEEFRQLRPFRGRPPSAVRKVALSVRLDPHVVEAFRAMGPGWQTRMNEVLRAFVARSGRTTRA